MRLLPAPRRSAIAAVYEFCRAVDDVADGPLSPPAKLSALGRWHDAVDQLYDREAGASPRQAAAPDRPSPRLIDALAGPVKRFDLKRADFHAVIDGMEMDAAGKMVAPDADSFDRYVDCVASAVGRLSAAVFGIPPATGPALAGSLGPALQMTNILRDLGEDARRGRLYLPRDVLAGHGLTLPAHERLRPDAVLADPAIDAACHDLADRAEREFALAARLLDGCPPGPARAPRIMLAAYARLLARLRMRGFAPAVLAQPVRLGRIESLGIALRVAVGGARSPKAVS